MLIFLVSLSILLLRQGVALLCFRRSISLSLALQFPSYEATSGQVR